jgi:uncharacterized protein DUF5682
MDERVHLFGIRHHGPGSAASLVAALDRLDPKAVLIEGPSDADELLRFAALPGMQPPIALLVHAADEPKLASFFPFASFSPEWRALLWALARERPVRFIDWPAANALAVRKEREAAETQASEGEGEDGGEGMNEAPPAPRRDPLEAIAQVSGHSDGEAFWNAMVESVGGSPDVFPIIETAMHELRDAQAQSGLALDRRAEDDERREAFMRLQIREALADTDGAIAVVTGAWHVPALRAEHTVAADRAALRGLPKLKTAATWVPWTEARLAMASGYGAGVASPGWYGHLWSQTEGAAAWPNARDLAASWLSKVATLLRTEGQPASTASVIEAVRLAIALAGLRGHAMPGLAEMRDATLSALCHGDEAPVRLIETRLVLGDRVGQIDDGVPQMPLAADLARWQRRTRLAPEALESEIAVDLRSEAGLLKSTLLHRLDLIAVPWGRLVDAQAGRGTFREVWKLAWQPEFSVRLAEALVHGPTIELAAAGSAVAQAAKATAVADLAQLVQRCLFADLADAAQACIARLQAAAVNAADLTGLATAVPPLVSVLRYGTARKIPEEAIAALTRALAVEVIAGASQASRNLDDEAAERWRAAIAGFDAALDLFGDATLLEGWCRTLTMLAADAAVVPVIAGLAARRLYERAAATAEATAATLSRALSPANPPKAAAGFLDGFFGRSAEVILHDRALFAIVDDWLASPPEEDFLEILPVVRRAFASFGATERRRLLEQVGRGDAPARAAVTSVDEAAFAAALPLLRLVLGMDDDAAA